jgi:hypothetical protein
MESQAETNRQRRLLRTRILTVAMREKALRGRQDGRAYFSKDASWAGLFLKHIPEGQGSGGKTGFRVSQICHPNRLPG